MKRDFSHRQALIDHVKSISHLSDEDEDDFMTPRGDGGIDALRALDIHGYADRRNHHPNGSNSQLSPFLRHGLLTPPQVKAQIDHVGSQDRHIFLKQLCWREYWHQWLSQHPEHAWEDAEAYKTGFEPSDYADTLSQDIVDATTDCTFINALVTELKRTGNLHNHCRLYLAAYIVHWRRIKWQCGAKFFLRHLLDADIASNNLSWQWVASTFSHKPYFFNLANVQKYIGNDYPTAAADNLPLAASYPTLQQRLFPRLAAS